MVIPWRKVVWLVALAAALVVVWWVSRQSERLVDVVRWLDRAAARWDGPPPEIKVQHKLGPKLRAKLGRD